MRGEGLKPCVQKKKNKGDASWYAKRILKEKSSKRQMLDWKTRRGNSRVMRA